MDKYQYVEIDLLADHPPAEPWSVIDAINKEAARGLRFVAFRYSNQSRYVIFEKKLPCAKE